MSKYSSEFKLEVVQYYLKGYGYVETAKHFKIPSDTTVLMWVRKCQEHGAQGLIKNYTNYDGNFKKYVIEYMHSNHLSATEIAIKFNLDSFNRVLKWNVYIMRKGLKHSMRSDEDEEKI